jgi:NADPH:quinone reductase-like Zn-dependent oxidoreductase
MELQPGQTILIHGGAGGVGSMAVQFAKWRGAVVIATASEANHDLLFRLGADQFVARSYS